MMTGFLMAFGFGLGPLVGGITGQWAPAPLVTTYIPTLLLGALGLIALFRLTLPKGASVREPLRWHDVLPKLTWPGANTSRDRKSVVSGTGVSVRVEFGGRRNNKQKKE